MQCITYKKIRCVPVGKNCKECLTKKGMPLPPNYSNGKIEAKIQQRRLQILLHSYIYYELNDNIVDDTTWSKWATELADLQKKYPDSSRRVIYYHVFKDFDGSTGYGLSYDEKIIQKAKTLLALSKNG